MSSGGAISAASGTYPTLARPWTRRYLAVIPRRTIRKFLGKAPRPRRWLTVEYASFPDAKPGDRYFKCRMSAARALPAQSPTADGSTTA